MTPRDVLNLPVLREGGISEMCNCSNWPLLPDEIQWNAPEVSGLVVKVHGEAIEDHRRFWSVFSVWFNGRAIAVGRMAGREGDDSWDRWIIDEAGYREYAAAVWAAAAPNFTDERHPLVHADDEIGDVLTWYGETVRPGERRMRGWY